MANDLTRLLRHSTYIARLENQALRSYITPSLAETLRDIRRILSDYEDVTNQRALIRLEREIERVIHAQSGWAALNTELLDLAQYENEFIAGWTGAGTAAATSEQVRRLASRTFMVLRAGERYDAGLWSDFVAANLDNQARQVSNIVRAGYANGTSARDLRRQISGLYDGMLARNAETLVRTGYTHHATIGRRAFFEANKDIIKREVPLTVFDSRSSKTCLSIAAKYGQRGWPVGESPIGYPAYHYNCRTTIVPLVEGENSLDGMRTARGAEGGTQIDASTTIDEFVRSQPVEWQNELLGVERARLFREGKIELRDLTNAQLRPLTLDELRDLGD